MKKLKLSNSEARLLFLLLALILLAVSYFLIFNKCVKKAEEIEALNEENRTKVEKLEMMVSRQAEVEAETAEMERIIEEIIAKYPSSVTTEKAIAIVQEVENEVEVHVSNISFLMDNLLGDIAASENTTEDGTVQAVSEDANIGYYAALSMNYEADYEEFKKMITYINGLKDRVTIPSISATFDNETGLLSGVITVHMYYLTNTGKEYEEPEISGIGKGTEKVFETSGVRSNGYLQSEVGSTNAEEDGNDTADSENAVDSENAADSENADGAMTDSENVETDGEAGAEDEQDENEEVSGE